MEVRQPKGQAYAEFIVALAILVPLLMFLPTMANLLSAQTEAHKAARYVAWERTAYPINQSKTDSDIADEVKRRFLEYPESGFGEEADVGFRRPWRDFGSRDLEGKIVDLDRQAVVVASATPESATDGFVNASANIAGIGGQNNPNHAIQLNTKQTTRISIPISDNSLLQATRITSVWFAERIPDADPQPPRDVIADENRFFVASSTSIVSDSWVSVSEAMFSDRVSSLTSGSRNVLRAIEWVPAHALSFFGFDEIDEHLFRNEAPSAAFEMVDDEQSVNLPQRLQEY